jgi:uncharacterized spore protein YtfJ
MNQVDALVGQVTDTLADIAQSDVVVGAPLDLGGVTVVVVSRVLAGFGGGGGDGQGTTPAGAAGRKSPAGQGRGQGVGSGGAARVRPVAAVVFGATGVEVLPIEERTGRLERLLDQLPALVDRFREGKA